MLFENAKTKKHIDTLTAPAVVITLMIQKHKYFPHIPHVATVNLKCFIFLKLR